MATSTQKTAKVVARLRSTFLSGLTRPLAWRLKQLDGIWQMLVDLEAEFAQALHEDVGKSPYESYYSEICYLKSSCKYTMKNLKEWMASQKVGLPLVLFPSSAFVVPEPLGVVLVISPWNFPLALSLDPVIGAIAAGNTVVLKPSEYSMATSAAIAKHLPLYVDSSAVHVFEGGVAECTALLEQKWDKIFYTGSSTVGKIIMTAAAKHLTPVILELGGKCPVIIDSTVDLKVAVRRIISGKWGCCNGQACIAADYILAEESISDALVTQLKETILEFYGDDPSLSKDKARIVNAKNFHRLAGLLEDPLVAKCIVHGGLMDDKKLYIEPTILLDPPLDSLIMKEEIFGPLLPIIRVKSIDETMAFINDRPKPLVVYVFTNNDKLKERATKDIIAGSVAINDLTIQFLIDGLPFGGVGESGMGSYHGKYSFDAFSHPKSVFSRTLMMDINLRYPPFNALKESIGRRLLHFDYVGAFLIILGFKR